MNKTGLGLLAALGVASTLALAADPGSDAARRDRMDQAYQNYQSRNGGGSSSVRGGAREAGHAIGNAARKTGHVIGNAARKTGHAIGTGMRKTGEAIDRGGEKLQGSSTPAKP